MRDNWERAVLADICEKIQDGAHHSPQKLHLEGGPGRFLYLTSKNIRNGYLDLSTVSFVDADYHESIYPRCNPQFGDVLLTKDGANTGNISLNTLDEPFSLLSSVCLIKANPARLYAPFLVYFLQSREGLKRITGQMTGAAIKRIILRTIKASTIPLPPLTEQKRIVAIVDEAFKGIDKSVGHAERNLTNAQDLFESYLTLILSEQGGDWEASTLGEIALVKGGKRLPKGHKVQKAPTPYPYISVSDFTNGGTVEPSSIGYLTPDAYSQIRQYTISGDDLYISIAGTIGKSGIVPRELDGANLTENACKLVFRRPVEKRFVYYFTRSRSFREQAMSRTRTTAQPKLALARIRTIALPLPPRVEQRRLVAKLDRIASECQNLEAAYCRKRAVLNELKQSILQKVFTGGLTAKEADRQMAVA